MQGREFDISHGGQRPLDGPAYAAALAPEIDRLALCIHRPTGRRPDLMAALGPLGLPPRSFVVACARPLATGRISIEDVALMSRYQPRAWAEGSIDAHVRRGLLEPAGSGSYVVTAPFRDGAAVVLRLQSEEAGRLWAGQQGVVDELIPLAEGHVTSAEGQPSELPAFRRQVATHPVLPDGPAAQLLGRLTELRYLRSDVHAECLAAAGLGGRAAVTLSRLWKGFGAGDAASEPLTELEGRGLCSRVGGEWVVTDAGRHLRRSIEEATDTSFADVVSGVTAPSCGHFLEGLARLPGDDPRPVEDR